MSETNKDGSAAAGSPDTLIQTGPSANDGGNGEPGGITNTDGQQTDNTVSKKEYEEKTQQFEELEKKLGAQGQEVGELRSFIRSIEPVLDQLEQSPELLQALMDGKIDSSMVKSVVEGKVDADDAQTVTEAHEKVKKEMGNKAYKKATPEEIEEQVNEKLKEQEKNFEKKLEETKKSLKESIQNENSIRDFQDDITNFIKETKDFPDYAEAVYGWLEKHQDIDDIGIAYNAVKAEAILKAQEKDGQKTRAEIAKEIAANAGGGASQNANVIDDKDVVDELIAGSSNPNRV